MNEMGDKIEVVPRVNVLGVGVHAVNMKTAVKRIMDAAVKREKGYVCVTGAHGVIESLRDEALARIHNRSFLTVPDGMPVVWSGCLQGFRKMGRIYGPDMMLEVMRATAGARGQDRRLTHFLYGGKEGVAPRLKLALESLVPGVEIVGTYTPPFGPLNEEQFRGFDMLLRQLKPDFLWVGLSTPKQERFMAEMSGRLHASVMLGVGAAFDIHLGLIKDAPACMKRAGLQWLHRLCSEPRRLWRRYAVIVPLFACHSFLQLAGFKSYSMQE